MNYYIVSSLYEAYALVLDFKKAGRYDWFRGQIHSWPIISSLSRLPKEKSDSAIEKLNRFATWASSIQDLKELPSFKDAVLAIAQHYGIPTPLVDFTTSPEVACFFASDGVPFETKADISMSCIYCLSTSEVNAVLKTATEDMNLKPRLLDISIKSHWRLQAQKSVFFYLPWRGEMVEKGALNSIFSIGTIQFPFSRRGLNFTRREDIYPTRKSTLENILEQYFATERVAETRPFVREFYGESIIELRQPDHSKHFKGNTLPPKHSSWDTKILDEWISIPDEKHKRVISNRKACITIPYKNGFRELGESCRDQINRTLIEIEYDRDILLDFLFIDGQGNSICLNDQESGTKTDVNVGQMLNKVWDGMRNLPFTNEHIFSCLAHTLLLLSWDYFYSNKNVFHEYGTQNISLRFGANPDSYTVAIIPTYELYASIRSDLWDHLSAEGTKILCGTNPDDIFRLAVLPAIIFDFDHLVSLFAEYIIPSQALIRYSKELIYYSPAHIGFMTSN